MSNDNPRYLDPDQPVDARVRDLVSRMTLDEKVFQMISDAPAVERLGIPAYNWWNEALHGIARAGLATVFPQAIGLAATWNTRLMRKVADIISTEGRAKHHEALRKGQHGGCQGLTFWSPNINIFRDPRWGRGHETYGECPYLTARMGIEFVKGIQGDDPKYYKAVACAKHYAVHSGPESLRRGFDVHVSKRDLYETYLAAFEALVKEGKVGSVMGAYNRVSGEPCCASKTLLADILRGQWKFDGHVMSDCGAICFIYQHHKTVETPEEASALAVNAGCDLNCGDTYQHLARAAHLGLISEETIDRSLSRLMRDRFRLGMFDPPDRVAYAQTPYELNNCPAHGKAALHAARESLVLLKNEGNLLPLKKDAIRNVAVVGPGAMNVEVLLGNYNGLPDQPVTLLDGIRAALPKATVRYVQGCEFTKDIMEGGQHRAAAEIASKSDVVIACLGISPTQEGEEECSEGDRAGIELPEVQVRLLQVLAKAGKPIVLVLTGGSALAVNWAQENVPAILMSWYPGQAGGTAVADAIFGKYNPAGRLPVTFYKSTEQLPPFEDYNMQGHTYRFFKGRPLYPFGFGLSYTKFEYSNLRVPGEVAVGKNLKIAVDVANVGQVAGDEVAQLYLSHISASVPTPIRQLAGFERIRLAAGEKKSVTFTLNPLQLACVADDGRRMIEPGEIELTVGGGQPDPTTPSNILTGKCTVTGEKPKLLPW
jgi:beta-glucosidase